MSVRWTDFDRTLMAMDEFRRRMDRLWDEYDDDRVPATTSNATWPHSNLWDAGESLQFVAEVPGLSEKDLKVSVHEDVITLAGERKASVPEGYSVHRQERNGVRFSRSFTLPFPVDAERTTATVKNGLLTVTLPKTAESKPRQIAVRGS
jgi:HSP20 family protein